MTPSRPSPQEIDAQLRLARQRVLAGRTCHPDLTYEDGVALALEWALIGQTPPLDAEEEDKIVRFGPARELEGERVAVLRLSARASTPTLVGCLQRIGREWPLEDVRNFLAVYSEQRVARAALLAIAGETEAQTAVEAPLSQVNEVLLGSVAAV